MTATEGVVVLIGRVLFAAFFIRSGIAHVRKHEGMKGYAGSAGFPLPEFGGWPAGVWLLAGAASIALGIWADLGSLMIALFLVPCTSIGSGRSATTSSVRRRRAASTGTSRCSARRSRCGGSSWPAARPSGSPSRVRCSDHPPFRGRRQTCSAAPFSLGAPGLPVEGSVTAVRPCFAASRSLRLFH